MPSLKALRAFEAAARLGSFTAAGRELFVTQGAVSRLVQSLERDIGVSLFTRRGRHLDLTPEGRRYAATLGDGFRTIRQATEAIRFTGRPDVLTVSVLPSFATKWLAPRLAAFLDAHPTVDLRISASRQLTDFDDGVDAAIRYGAGDWPGTISHLLMRDEVFPVCSPDLLAPEGPLAGPADLADVTLLHGDAPEDWAVWLEAAGLEGPNLTRGPRFSDGAALAQAAIDGAGVALGRISLVGLDLKAGRLVRPFGPTLTDRFACYLVRPAGRPPPRHFEAFKTWILGQMSKERADRSDRSTL